MIIIITITWIASLLDQVARHVPAHSTQMVPMSTTTEVPPEQKDNKKPTMTRGHR
jgi:hypothetical protein